jgi:hypothetical protein
MLKSLTKELLCGKVMSIALTIFVVILSLAEALFAYYTLPSDSNGLLQYLHPMAIFFITLITLAGVSFVSLKMKFCEMIIGNFFKLLSDLVGAQAIHVIFSKEDYPHFNKLKNSLFWKLLRKRGRLDVVTAKTMMSKPQNIVAVIMLFYNSPNEGRFAEELNVILQKSIKLSIHIPIIICTNRPEAEITKISKDRLDIKVITTNLDITDSDIDDIWLEIAIKLDSK